MCEWILEGPLIRSLKYEWDTEGRHHLLPHCHHMAESLPMDPCALPPDPTNSLRTDTIVSHEHTNSIG